MNIPFKKSEKVAGLFLIFGLIAIFLSAVIVGGGRDWFRSYNKYFVLYNQGYGLAPGVKVKFLRTDVGKVSKLELTPNNMVKVHIVVLTEYASRIRTDSQAAIQSPTLIGSEFIDIVPSGNPDAEIIPPGGQIPARPRKSLDDIITDLKLEEKLRQFESILANIDSLTKQLQDPAGPLLGTMANVRQMTAQVASGEGSLGQLINRDEMYQELYDVMAALETTSKNLAQSSDDLKKALPTILKRVENIAQQLEAASRSAPDISRSAREGLKDVEDVLESAKRNILIRGNLPEPENPSSVEYPARKK